MTMSDTLETGLATTSHTTTTEASAASGASSQRPAADNRPASIDEALARATESMTGEEPATSQSVPSPEASTPAPATGEPPAEDATTQREPVGPVPLDRHKATLENARKKATEDATEKAVQQFQQQYGGALHVVEALRTDLPGTLGQLLQEAITSPEHGPAVKAMVGRMLNGLRQRAAPAPADVEPELFVEQNGERYLDPAALQQWQSWHERQLEARLAQKFAPLAELQQSVQQAQAFAQLQAEAKQTVEQRLKIWHEQPGFTDHQAAIAAKQKELFANGLDEWTALGVAYAQVVPPLLNAKQTAQWVQDAATKSRGSTPNPVTSAPAQLPKARTVDEALEQVFNTATA